MCIRDRNIILGNDTLNIPDYLRFIATINYDGTTEPLSPRLINRCPIIILDNPSDTTEHDVITQSIIESQPIAAVSMKELFGTSQKVPELEAVELAIYSQIKKVLVDVDANYGRPISISPRKENAIYQYCGKARMLMNVDNDLMALDFAIQQNVLPLIQGHGSKFAKRLELLKTILVDNDLKESARTLQRIIAFGESDLQSFDFFCW